MIEGRSFISLERILIRCASLILLSFELNIQDEELKALRWVDDLTEEERKFLLYLPFTITIPNYKAIIVHAGLVPTFAVEEQDLFVMYSLRNLHIKDEVLYSLLLMLSF
jgi:hypothetical protein